MLLGGVGGARVYRRLHCNDLNLLNAHRQEIPLHGGGRQNAGDQQVNFVLAIQMALPLSIQRCVMMPQLAAALRRAATKLWPQPNLDIRVVQLQD